MKSSVLTFLKSPCNSEGAFFSFHSIELLVHHFTGRYLLFLGTKERILRKGIKEKQCAPVSIAASRASL